MARLFFTLLLPIGTWFLFGEPKLGIGGNAVLMGVVVLFELNLVWRQVIFRGLKGSDGIYGAAASAITAFLTVVAVAIAGLELARHQGTIAGLSALHPWSIFCWIVCFFGSWILPILSTAPSAELPRAASNRSFEDPKS